MQIVFLQNSATQPRCHKRFRSFKRLGVDGVVYSFDRNWYNVNLPKDMEIHSLGKLNPGSYFKRFFLYIKKLRPVFKKHEGSIFYCYGQDIALVAYLLGRKFVYEESDLMYLGYKESFVGKVMKKVDTFLQRKSIATVLTSQGFVEYLYGEGKCPQNVFVIPNKLDSFFLSYNRPLPKQSDIAHLNFAFIGLIRYERYISAFVEEMVAFNPNYEFHIWGDGAADKRAFVDELCAHFVQVKYHGPFRNPIDLPEISSKVDFNFICYNAAGLNEKIAEPNKLYESTFFNTPVLVSPSTYLSKVIRKWDTGFIIDCNDREDIRRFLRSLSADKIEIKKNNSLQINAELLISDSSDEAALINTIAR